MKPLSDEVKAILDNAPRWESIDMAPRDGSDIVVGIEWRHGMLYGIARWVDNQWDVRPFERRWPDQFVYEQPIRELTHWLPLNKADELRS